MLSSTELIIRLLLATLFGGLVGFEREYSGKSAGVRTYALVSVGSALFTLLSSYGFSGTTADPSRIASQVVVGIGFLGAGEILHRGNKTVVGLTTAAGLWVAAAIGMAIAVGWYDVGIVTSILVVLLLHVVGSVRYRVEHPKK